MSQAFGASSAVRLLSAPVLLMLLMPAEGSAAADSDRDDIVRHAAECGESVWRNVTAGNPNMSSRELFTYALALCEADMHLDRLPRLFELAAKMQDRDPESRGYGNFRWRWSEGGVFDFNAVEFCMQGGAVIWIKHKDKLPAAARETLRELLDYSVKGCLRHGVSESYTNIALMNAENLILLGEALGLPEVAAEGYARLDRVCLYTSQFGIHEYCSPTYYGVDLDCLLLTEAFTVNERARKQSQALLELFWTDIALNWFPEAQRLGGARSRDYDYLRGLGYLDTQMWAAGWLPGERRGGLGLIHPSLGKWRAPEKLRKMNAELFPRLVRQRWGIGVGQSRTHYLNRDVTLSSSGANYGPMDMPLTVDLAGERTSVRCYFIPDARRDPYGKKKIPAGPHQKTLHLRPFWTAAQQTTDALGLVVYRDGDMPETPSTLESHFVMPMDADSFWIGDRPVSISADRTRLYPLNAGDALVLRKGTAAVGVRVPWARALDGKAARVALVYDGNDHGAVRLSVAHHDLWGLQDKQLKAGACFWVRIGSGLETEEAFHQWMRAFRKADARVVASAEEIHVRVEGADAALEIATAAPYAGPLKISPAPTKAVLELNGEDIGGALLSGIEPMTSLAEQEKTMPPIDVPAGSAVLWEAEAGVVVTPMVVAEDADASGGKYVWMPGEPGRRAGSSLGNVTWRLKVAKGGKYYFWGRIMAPSPEDDSFHVRAFTESGEPLGMTEWHTGVHKGWEWTQFVMRGTTDPMPLALPEGEVFLQLRVREDGTKVDRLCITPSPDAKPE